MITVNRGDEVTIAAAGEILYKSEHRLSQRVGPWGALDEPLSRNCYCEEAKIGALVWRIGELAERDPSANAEPSPRPCRSASEFPATFTAEASGPLLFMVNDERGRYDDNSGAFRATVTVARK